MEEKAREERERDGGGENTSMKKQGKGEVGRGSLHMVQNIMYTNYNALNTEPHGGGCLLVHY